MEWARDLFAGAFVGGASDAAAFVAAPSAWLAAAADEVNLHARRTKLEGVLSMVHAAGGASWPMCIRLARELFHLHFTTSIAQLLHNFPADYVDAHGIKFWSGPKRPPTPAVFDAANDPLHFDFVVHAAALFAQNFGVPVPPGGDTRAAVLPILAGIHLAPFEPKSGVKIKANDADATVEGADDDRDAVAAATAELTSVAGKLEDGASKALSAVAARLESDAAAAAAGHRPLSFSAVEFEKDDDSNHHIDFIACASNLRARNYKIKEATRLEVKITAGKIIPAVATTTCAVTGLVALEFYKVVQGMVRERHGALSLLFMLLRCYYWSNTVAGRESVIRGVIVCVRVIAW